MIEMLRDVECLETICRRYDVNKWIHEFSKLIFNRLKYWLLTINDVDFNCVPQLPISVLTVLLGSLFEKTMQVYNDPENKKLGHKLDFEADIKILSDYILEILIKLLKKCNNCAHELVLESINNSIKYLVLEHVDHKYLFSLCSDLINSDCYPIEIVAYRILNKFVFYENSNNCSYLMSFMFLSDCVSCVK